MKQGVGLGTGTCSQIHDVVASLSLNVYKFVERYFDLYSATKQQMLPFSKLFVEAESTPSDRMPSLAGLPLLRKFSDGRNRRMAPSRIAFNQASLLTPDLVQVKVSESTVIADLAPYLFFSSFFC